MNRTLVLCLMLAILGGATAAAAAFAGGWGWLAALAVYSLAGSAMLVATTTVAAVFGPEPCTAVSHAADTAEKPLYA